MLWQNAQDAEIVRFIEGMPGNEKGALPGPYPSKAPSTLRLNLD